MITGQDSYLDRAGKTIRNSDIIAKEIYFEEDLKTDDKLREFESKYHTFRDNYIEHKPNKTKQDNIDNQHKLIQAMFPGIQMDEMTSGVLASVTLLYAQEIIEQAKEIAVKNENAKISQADVVESIRLFEFRNQHQMEGEFEKFFQ